ncbi:MAG: PAS domain S-box protein, partial [Desulfobacterota bacterium]|nr:PAS domain S-box protein [Thermodesulfobacteriota bacterium]
ILKERFVPVIYLSAYSDEETVLRAKRTEPYAYLTKPINELELRLNIEMALYKAAIDKKLRESEQLYRTIIETIGEGIIGKEASGKIIQWNKTAEEIFGIPALEAIGRTSLGYLLPTIYEDGSPFPGHQHPSMHTLRTGEPCHNVIMGIQKQDGDCRWVSINTKPLFTSKDKKPSAVVISFRDITAFRQVLERLKENETRYELILFGADLGTWDWHIPSGKVVFNERWAEMLGYSLKETEQHLHTWESLVHPDDRKHVLRVLYEHLEGKIDHYESEHRLRHKSGRWVWVFDKGKVIERDAAGKPIRACGTHLDITMRKQTENVYTARLRLLELASSCSLGELLRATLDECELLTESQVGFYHFIEADQQTISLQAWSTNTIEKFCRAAGKGLHYPVQDAGVWVDCFYQKKPVIHNDYASLPHRKGIPEGHVPIIRELVVPVIRNQKVVAILGVGNKKTPYDDYDVNTISIMADLAWDIAEKKKNEETLKRITTAIEQTHEAIIIASTEGNIEYVNPAFERITGYTPQEAIGKNPRILKSGIHDEQFYTELWETITSGKTWEGQFINRRKDGMLYNEAAVISPVKNQEGKIVNFVAIKRDITNELRIEEQLRQAQKMEAIGTLASGIAHDFNNIIAGIMNYAEIGLDEINNTESVRESFSWILKLCDRAADMVRQILAFSRQTPRERQPVQLQSFAKESLKLLRATIPANIALHSNIAPDTGYVYADITHLHQILINLCANAAYVMREHGGTITVSVGNEHIAQQHSDFPTLPLGEYVRIEVADTGPGIPKELQKKIFDPFFTTKKPGEGTGIGLSIVHSIVTSYQGAIAVHSEPGQGATFIILLPQIQETTTDEMARCNDNAPLQSGTEHILLIDDEQPIRESMAIALQKLGYTVTTCENGIEALHLFQENPTAFQLVITDQTMPGITGHVLAQRLIQLRPDIPIILMTGYSALVDPSTIQAFGVKKLLIKPVHHATLAQEIRKALEE